jgi:hypothetical protein
MKGGNMVLKTIFWCITLAGLTAPVFLASLTWGWVSVRREFAREAGPSTASSFSLIHEWSIQLGPLSMRYFPHVWAAVAIIAGSVLVVFGVLWILHVPKAAVLP